MLTDYVGNRVRIIIRGKNKAIIGDYMTYKLDKETAAYFSKYRFKGVHSSLSTGIFIIDMVKD